MPYAPDVSNEGAEPQAFAEKMEDTPQTSVDSRDVQPQFYDMDECTEQFEVGYEDEATSAPALQKASGFQFSRVPGACVTGIVSACGGTEMLLGKPRSFDDRV